MRQFIIDKLLQLEIIDSIKVAEYVDFCLDNSIIRNPGTTQNHHILPKAVFKEYSDLTEHKWNSVHLNNDIHYIAHSLLCLCIDNYSFKAAWYAMNNKNYKSAEPIKLIGADTYNHLIVERNKAHSASAKLVVMAKDLLTGKNVRVPRKEFDSNNNLVGVTSGRGGEHLIGTMSVIGNNGKNIRINKCDYDPLKHIHPNKNKAWFKDSDKNTYFISTSDQRVLSGEYKGLMHGEISKHKGINHNRFCGYYITPWGKYPTAREAHENYTDVYFMSESMIKNYCKYTKIITKNTITRSKYFCGDYNLVGKTYKEIGFTFEKEKEHAEYFRD